MTYADVEHLEEKCVRPGLWEIEGVTVRHVGRWWVVEWDPPETVRTLRGARLLIVDEINHAAPPPYTGSRQKAR